MRGWPAESLMGTSLRSSGGRAVKVSRWLRTRREARDPGHLCSADSFENRRRFKASGESSLLGGTRPGSLGSRIDTKCGAFLRTTRLCRAAVCDLGEWRSGHSLCLDGSGQLTPSAPQRLHGSLRASNHPSVGPIAAPGTLGSLKRCRLPVLDELAATGGAGG